MSVAPAEDGIEEPLGTKDKYWVVRQSDETDWLWKQAREVDGRVLGEDWAEWIVHHVGTALGVPTAHVLPATSGGRRGIVSCRTNDPGRGERLDHGNSLLREVVAGYNSAATRENPDYTVQNIQLALRDAGAPFTFDGPTDMDGFDVWAGYVLLDAWVAGRDRHHENWAVISMPSFRTLSPSFDHGNALGFQETAEKLTRLNADAAGLSRWLGKGRSHHFRGRPALVDVAFEALGCASETAQRFWTERLQSVDMGLVADIVQTVPSELMSEAARTFAINVLQENRERLIRGNPVSSDR